MGPTPWGDRSHWLKIRTIFHNVQSSGNRAVTANHGYNIRNSLFSDIRRYLLRRRSSLAASLVQPDERSHDRELVAASVVKRVPGFPWGACPNVGRPSPEINGAYLHSRPGPVRPSALSRDRMKNDHSPLPPTGLHVRSEIRAARPLQLMIERFY